MDAIVSVVKAICNKRQDEARENENGVVGGDSS
jgi:hypothetical protein